MQEYSSISVSTYDPDSLTGLLNEQAAAGWNVVSIVPTGSTVTAFLSREASTEAAADTGDEAAPAEVAPEPAAEIAPEPAPEPAAEIAPEPAAEIAPEPAAEIAPEPAAEIAPEPAAEPMLPTSTAAPEPAPEPAAQPAGAASAAPAGWYADPSSRYELRYWDGSTWTEHVSRAGQQYTDPPVA